MISRAAQCYTAAAQALGIGNNSPKGGSTIPRSWERQRATTADWLFELLMTQQADGSFRLSPVLQHWLGQRWPAVKQR